MRSPALARVGEDLQRAAALGRRAQRAYQDAASLYAEGLAGRARAFRAREARRSVGSSPRSSAVAVAGDGELWHDDGDRAELLERLHGDFRAFSADVGPDAQSATAPPSRRQWWDREVRPALAEWASFFDGSRRSWARRTATDWDTYEDWLDRLRDLRSSARAHGITLRSPEPADLPKTVYQRAASGCGSDGEAWWTLGRVALYTAIGVIGVITLA